MSKKPLRSDYSVDELQLFATYVAARAQFRPAECKEGEHCWVERGPPAITTNGYCLGCDVSVAARWRRRPATYSKPRRA